MIILEICQKQPCQKQTIISCYNISEISQRANHVTEGHIILAQIGCKLSEEGIFWKR